LVEELWLCNAHHVKNVPGRKTDMADAEWLADVVAHGMVRPSLVPPPPIRALRNLTRIAKDRGMRTKEKQRLEKVLQDAGIKLSSVASKIMTASGRAMIEALIADERDTKVLAEMSMRKLRNKKAELEEALAGRFDEHHALLANEILAHIDHLHGQIQRVTTAITARVAPYRAAAELCMTIPGVGAVVADTTVAETGADMSRFPTPRHLAAWAGVAPASKESAAESRSICLSTRPFSLLATGNVSGEDTPPAKPSTPAPSPMTSQTTEGWPTSVLAPESRRRESYSAAWTKEGRERHAVCLNGGCVRRACAHRTASPNLARTG
jgi:transposase